MMKHEVCQMDICYRANLALRLPLFTSLLACLLFQVGLASTPRIDAGVVLVAPGVPSLTISLREQAGEVERFAAVELARYLELITGTHFDWLQTNSPPTASIHLEAGAGSGDAYSITAGSHGIHLRGESGRAALFAAYKFLEKLGCRWLAPSFGFYAGAAEWIPRTNQLIFASTANEERAPKFAFRKLDVAEGLSHDEDNLNQLIDWMPKAGFNTLMVPMDFGAGRVQWDKWRKALAPELRKRGIRIEVGGHGYENLLHANMPDLQNPGTTLFEKRPEWFGMNDQGRRDRSKKRVFCTSNSAATAHVASQVVDYLSERPEIDIFDFWPPDGALWCECGPCKGLGPPEDRQALLLQRVHDSLSTNGLQKVRLEIIAYSKALLPPTRAALPKDVLVDFCPINQSFEAGINSPSSSRNVEYVQALRKWRQSFSGDLTLYSYYRKYAWKSLPALLPHYLQNDLRFYATLPLQGVHVYAEPGDWATFELNHYVLARLAWDPDQDLNPVIREFCVARYGEHSDLARQVLEQMEKIVRTTCSLPFTSLKSAQTIEAARGELSASRTALARSGKSWSEQHSVALKRLQLCLDYAILDLDLQKGKATGTGKRELRKKVEELVGFLTEHRSDGVFVVTGRNDLDRFYIRYGLTASNTETTLPDSP